MIQSAAKVPALRVLGDQIRILLPHPASPARLAVADLVVQPGSQVPPHYHAATDECYYLMDGALEVQVGAAAHRLGAGDFLHLPAGTVHGYRNTSREPAHALVWTVGEPIDAFFVDLAAHVRELPRDAEALQRVLSRHDVVMVAPTC